ncbi:prepilin peptidase-dependent protein [Candidatus Symbiopectobacterium sp. NZEC135]|uniref:prepilin peptidase-dependent protein n=1 Tax=Candidatus Symbiopectobacterium sp. NZEC135 TaxID=2820471 RepID=UPI0022277391|nr:prepilin peptidase-dependent protein [Candidatus Symbiopectobacterium sp. NZEC135]MCW2479928.1 prepilin peptidase-dependent protein [Candidatus Symbiopectobacterium sp. NZEC135]
MDKSTFVDAGFSLPELLVALTLIALLSAGGIQGWTAYQQAVRLEHQTQLVMLFLQRVQANAYWYNDTRTVSVIQTGEVWCLREGTGASLSCYAGTGGRLLPSVRDVRIAAMARPTVTFYGLRNTAQAGHLVLENGAGRLRIVISIWGRIRLCSDTQPVLGIPRC